jgi:23S rRNA pseudouridine1911/1915/1917 synthase
MPYTHISLSNPADVGRRLDTVLADCVSDLSRSRIQVLIKSGHILVNGRSAKARQPVELDDNVTIEIPAAAPSTAVAEPMDLDILFEDDYLLVLNKPSGMVVHPGAGHGTGTLVNALLAHCGSLSTIGGVERPGIVHRLDKDTSGCMVVAKNDAAHQELSRQFADRETTKHYLAVARGRPSAKSGRIENHLGRHPVNRQKMAVVEPKRGKLAITDYEVGGEQDNASLMLCKLFTGRTHQIRVHCHSLGHALLGDEIYGRSGKQHYQGRLLLHAWLLGFQHPTTKEAMRWRSIIPKEYEPWLDDETLKRWQSF